MTRIPQIRTEVPDHLKRGKLGKHVAQLLSAAAKRNIANQDCIDHITIKEVVNQDGTTQLVPFVVGKLHPQVCHGSADWGPFESSRGRRYFTD